MEIAEVIERGINNNNDDDDDNNNDNNNNNNNSNSDSNDKIISLNRRIKTKFLFNISNKLFCFSNKLSEITASIIKLHLHL